jgi:hypothetical protein
LADCSFSGPEIAVAATDSLRSLLAAFRSAQTMSMAYLAPIPSCDHAEEMAARHYANLPLAPPLILPHRLFGNDGSYIHPLLTSVPVVTDQLAVAIQRALDGKTANPPVGQ